MALEKEAYQALESVIGPENITQDPAILLGYTYISQMADPDAEFARITRFPPAAVLLPETTEEVVGIVKACNKHRVKFKAFGTGWGPTAMPGQEGVIILDMRRMNRIIEIDPKNMSATIESYVTAGQLEAEAEKVGLTSNIIGAGSSHSVLASTTSMGGHGMKGTTTSQNNRLLLGAEWVLPTGELVKVGSMGSGAGNFTGDGPGPGLRGVLRGFLGACGGAGVFTKCTVKLAPWSGPAEPERIGEHPQVGMKLPENFKLYIAHWKDWDSQADAMYKINEAEIGFVVWRQSMMELALTLTTTNNKIPKHLKHLFDNYQFQIEVFLGCHSMGELEHQEKVLKDIVAETGGNFVPLDEEPFKDQIPVLNMAYVVNPYTPRVFRPTGDFTSSYFATESWDMSIKGAKAGTAIVKKWQDKGLLVQDGGEHFWGGPYERGRYTHFEGVGLFDGRDKESRKAGGEYMMATIDDSLKKGIQVAAMGLEMNDILGPSFCDFQLWLKKFKRAIDPNDLSDASFYVKTGNE